jgi:ribonucleoside-diphosphate reductase alpha chain
MIKIEELSKLNEVYDISVVGNENFFANDILVHNCVEITQPTEPMGDDNSLIALCSLSALNMGKFKNTKEIEQYARLAVRGLDALLDYQNYPVHAAERHTMMYRPLGIGVINLAHWLAKNDLKYQDISKEGLGKVHEWFEAFSYYLIQASSELAAETYIPFGFDNTKYSQGIMPIHTYKKEVDQIVDPVYKLDWAKLSEMVKTRGIRNATLMAMMPAETSAQISNATNGIEPPRALVSIKQSKDGILKQVVPQIQKLKNKYDLLWDQKSPEGYIKICAVINKFIDQSISLNTTYNPKFYPDNQIPMSEMLKHLIMMYKLGIKNGYYFNSHDGAGEMEMPELAVSDEAVADCDACVI